MKKVTTFSCIGLGGRSCVYLNALKENYSDSFKLVAIAEPDAEKRKRFAKQFDVPSENVFCTDLEFLQREKMSDVAIVGTQDRLHYREVTELIKKGYSIVLEKPIATEPEEVEEIYRLSKQYDSFIAVCHVLRHTKFFNTLKQIVDSGKLGKVVSIAHNENVGYYHFAHSYVRGSWRNSKESAPVIVAKSCHDMDILLYLLGNARPLKISSFGSLSHFTGKNFCPETMSPRCVDCSLKDTCAYSAVRIYGGRKIKSVVFAQDSIQQINAQLETSPYGRCVYCCDNDVCDHQATAILFENGVTATFNLSAFTAKVNRSIKIMCEFGEIRGIEKPYIIEYTDFRTDQTVQIPLDIQEGGHGGGDAGFVKDLMESLQNGKPFSSDLEESVMSHRMAFAAEQSRLTGKVVDIK